MIPVNMVSSLGHELLAIWLLLLCVCGIGIVACMVFQRRRGILAGCVPTITAFCMWQQLFDKSAGNTNRIFEHMGTLPCWLWIAFAAVLTIIMSVMLWGIFGYGRKNITPTAVKTCTDRMTCGICCWHDNGRVILSNIVMNRLCVILTKQPLLNGNSFREEIPDGYVTAEGRTWRFSYRNMQLDNETLHEMIASDITEEYLKTEALKRDTEELNRINRELEEYRLRMVDTVRQQEILQAKVNIHDEMNRLMLATEATEISNIKDLRSIFSMWKQSALMLCREAESDKMDEEKCEKLARQLNIKLEGIENIPLSLTSGQRELFFIASHEAVINAAKHAGARTVRVSFEEDNSLITCVFENDGEVQSGEIEFTGGLSNLVLMAKNRDVTVKAEAGETFRLILTFQKGD